MNVKQFTFNPFAENTYVAWDPESLEAVIIDPGMIDRAEEQRIADFIREKTCALSILSTPTCMSTTRLAKNLSVTTTG